MKAVAPANKLGVNPFLPTILAIGQVRRVAVNVMQCHVGRFIDDLQTTSGRRLHQVAGNLRLAIYHDLPSGQARDVNADRPLAAGQVKTVMGQPFTMHPLAKAQPVHQIGRGPLQHACADAAQDIAG